MVANTYHTYVTAHACTPEAVQKCVKLDVKGLEHGNLIDEDTAKLMTKNECYLTPTLVAYKIITSGQISSLLSGNNKVQNMQVLYERMEGLKIVQKKKKKRKKSQDMLQFRLVRIIGWPSNTGIFY